MQKDQVSTRAQTSVHARITDEIVAAIAAGARDLRGDVQATRCRRLPHRTAARAETIDTLSEGAATTTASATCRGPSTYLNAAIFYGNLLRSLPLRLTNER